MLLHITTMSSPAVELGAYQPLDAVEAIRKRRRSLGPPSWSTATAGGSVRPARGGPVGSICPDTENAPPCGRAERLRMVIAFRQNYPGQRIAYYAHFVAKRSCLPGNRQVSRKALLQRAARPNFSPHEEHTFANAPTFRDTVPAMPLLSQLSCAFGRIGNRIKPYSVSLPLLISSTTVPPDGVDEEVPHLDCSYCAP